MKTKKIEKYLNKLTKDTPFSVMEIEKTENALSILLKGNNPEEVDWVISVIMENPAKKENMLHDLCAAMWEAYANFNIETNVFLMLDAKRQGDYILAGCGLGIVDLVHNEEYKQEALLAFAEKLEALCREETLFTKKEEE